MKVSGTIEFVGLDAEGRPIERLDKDLRPIGPYIDYASIPVEHWEHGKVVNKRIVNLK